jgi:nitrous oxide reductase accessory protein NosL
MRKTMLAVLALAAFAAACHEQRQDPPPDYDGTRSDSARAQHGLDQEQVPGH